MGLLRRARREDVDVECCVANLGRLEAVTGSGVLQPSRRERLDALDMGGRAYLGVPLRHDGHCLGSFCVVDTEARQWTDADLAQLEELASEVLATAGQ